MQTLLSYIDPTTTSTLLYVIIGVAATVAYAFRGLFYKVKDALLFSKTGRSDACKLVIYSEGKQYWPVFRSVAEALQNSGVEFMYVSSDTNDPGLKSDSPLRHTRFVSPSLTPPFLNHLKANVVVMTTPQLDVLTIRRSKGVRHYVHLVHAPTDFYTYRKFAFDHFDTVMCANPCQIESARYLEKLRGYPPKVLLETGCTYYDDLVMRQVERESRSGGAGETPHARQVVLVAPTWKPYGYLNRFGKQMIADLLRSEYDVILRPHPQSFVSFPEVIGDIKREFDSHTHFRLDSSPDSTESLNASDMMISELSGIVFDYAFMQHKPTLIFNGEPDLRGFEAEDFTGPMWEIRVRNQVGREFGIEDIPRISDMVREMLGHHSSADLVAFRDASIFNFGHAGDVAARQIIGIMKKVDAESAAATSKDSQ